MNAQTKIEAAPTLAKLREPFPDHQISKLPKETKTQANQRKQDQDNGKWPAKCSICGGLHHPKAVHLDYVGHAALTDRLLDTDPEWSWEPVAFGPDGLPAFDRNGGLWIKLTVLGVTRLGYGDAEGKQGGNAIKEAIGDALRNAAMRFGAALDLWHKGDLHQEDEASTNGSGRDNSEARQASPTGPATHEQGDMPDAEFAKLTNLLKATGIPSQRLIKEYRVQSLRQLSQADYADALGHLNTRLAEMAKAETNKAASDFGDITDDMIPY